MKRAIFILALLVIVAITVRGQTATIPISLDETFKEEARDFTITNTTVVWFQWEAAKNMRATQNFEVNLDSLAGNHTNIAIKLYGKVFEDDSWTQIGSTVNSTTGTATETISNTAINGYRFYKSEFTGTGTGTTTIDWQKLKLWLE